MEHYVYVLLDPRNYYIPFYVGKGKGDRWRVHLFENASRTSNRRKHNRIQKIKLGGQEPAVLIWQSSLSEMEAFELEEQLIVRFGRRGFDPDGVLDNFCVSARPPGFLNCQDQDAFRMKISEATRGEKNHFFGKSHSPETRRKIGEAHRGRIISQSHRDAISASTKGRLKSESTKAKISASNKGKKKSQEHRDKIGDAHKGKTISQEHRSAISTALKGRVFSDETRRKLHEAALRREARKRKI